MRSAISGTAHKHSEILRFAQDDRELARYGAERLVLANVSGLYLAMNETIRTYLAEIGRAGGKKSRRTLDPETARNMVRVREARRAFRRYHATCFWSYRPDLVIGADDVEWVARTLMKHGDRRAWELGNRLCR